MQININPQKANNASAELLDLSRSVRRSREEVGEVLRQLRQLSDLDECRAALRRQEESLELLTGRLVNMSSSLREISAMYSATEERIADSLRSSATIAPPEIFVVYGVDSGVRRQINSILHK